MKTQNLLTAFSIIMLTACSSSPSDSDIKNAILMSSTLDNCKFISIDNIKKINGIEASDGKSYQITYEYTLKMKSIPNAEAILSSIANNTTRDAAGAIWKNEGVEIEKTYTTGCSKLNNFIYGAINSMNTNGYEWIKQDIEKKITGNLIFIKTDNGWMRTN